MLDEVGVGRDEGAVGRAMGIGIVRESLFEFRDATESDLIERVSMTLSSPVTDGDGGFASSETRSRPVRLSSCTLPPHCDAYGACSDVEASMTPSRLL